MKMTDPTTTETIEALGGVFAIARYLGITRPAVYNWRYFGVFPPRYYLLLAALAEEKKVFLDRKLFRERTHGKTQGDPVGPVE